MKWEVVVKRWAYRVLGGQGVGLHDPRGQGVGLEGPRGSRGGPLGLPYRVAGGQHG